MSKAIRKGNYAIKQIHFSRQGQYYLVNCGLSIRLFKVSNNQFEREFKDMVTNSVFVNGKQSRYVIY